MNFSASSEITVVVTSCGRFDLLRKTLDSLDKFNTAPIREVLITEDSGDSAVEDCIPANWRPHTRCFVNAPKLGQLKSIDLAYDQVKTRWIFHCEDDWLFYRPGFIEDSQILLDADPQALQVWLRSPAHDLAVHSPYVFLADRAELAHVPYYRLGSNKSDWQGFSFNPGLRRMADYQLYAPYSRYSGEKELSRLYAAEQRYALILENDAVLHTGFGEHVVVSEERREKARRKRRERARNVVAFILGLALGYLI